MRVRTTAPVDFTFDEQPITFGAGQVVGTPLADHMAREGMPVEIIDATLDPAAAVSGTQWAVLDWVNNDPERAALAVTAETAGSNRADLLAHLAAIRDA